MQEEREREKGRALFTLVTQKRVIISTREREERGIKTGERGGGGRIAEVVSSFSPISVPFSMSMSMSTSTFPVLVV